MRGLEDLERVDRRVGFRDRNTYGQGKSDGTNGQAVIDLPAGQETGLMIDKVGCGPYLVPNVTDENFAFYPRLTVPMMTHESLTAIADDLATPYPWKMGVVALQRWSPLAGVRFVPVGPTADAVGTAFYLDVAATRYSLEIEATTPGLDNAQMPLSQGGFVEVEPGVQQFEFTGNMNDCYFASWAWPGDAPNRIRIPVHAGYRTYWEHTL